MANIVQNTDKAYGYNYTSLASLAEAGIDIPKMRTATTPDGLQFIEYLDDNGEWQRGAQIVIPDMKGMNAAQAYGSALTYARRYTVMMARSVACTDDQQLETQEPKPRNVKRPANVETPERFTPPRETRKGRDTAPAPKPAEAPTEAATEPDNADPMICADCGKPIEPFGRFDIMTIATRSFASYGKYLCWDCAAKAKAIKEGNNA